MVMACGPQAVVHGDGMPDLVPPGGRPGTPYLERDDVGGFIILSGNWGGNKADATLTFFSKYYGATGCPIDAGSPAPPSPQGARPEDVVTEEI